MVLNINDHQSINSQMICLIKTESLMDRNDSLADKMVVLFLEQCDIWLDVVVL